MNLKYKVINSRTQYNKYCIELEDLLKTNPIKFKEEINSYANNCDRLSQ